MKPFLILQLRPETEAADDEYAAILGKAGLDPSETVRVRLDCEPLAADLRLHDYAGVIVGGGPGCVSDPPEAKTPTEARIEATILGLMPAITENDIPYLGCCYGIGILGHHLGARVSKERYGEDVGAVACSLTPAGRLDALTGSLPQSFLAFVGHKEAVQELPRDCEHLLWSEPCPLQMIRHKGNVYATQFHPEADAHGFEVRINIYKDKGYFPPQDAARLIAACHAQDVRVPADILRNFVLRYRGG